MDDRKAKIAAVSITMNDGYKFKEWCQHYKEYKDELYLHIIVDNHSDKEYLRMVKDYFNDSVIIERETNGGCTISYNDGIRYALKDPQVEYIALIGNDIRLKPGSLLKCVEVLRNDPKLGMVEPVLLKGWSNIVDDFGCTVSNYLLLMPNMKGCDYSALTEDIHYCEGVTGGMNVSKREFYETVGLQDEKLFMYSDEVDMALRAAKCGFKMAAIKDAVAWHEHINESKTGRRHPFNSYLVGRNKVYLANKHFGKKKRNKEFFFMLKQAILFSCFRIVKGQFSFVREEIWKVRGAYNGLKGNMESNRFSHF